MDNFDLAALAEALFRPDQLAVGRSLLYHGLGESDRHGTIWEITGVMSGHRWSNLNGKEASQGGMIRVVCRATGEQRALGADYVANTARWRLLPL